MITSSVMVDEGKDTTTDNKMEPIEETNVVCPSSTPSLSRSSNRPIFKLNRRQVKPQRFSLRCFTYIKLIYFIPQRKTTGEGVREWNKSSSTPRSVGTLPSKTTNHVGSSSQ